MQPQGGVPAKPRATPWVSESPPSFFASPEGAAQRPSIPHIPLVVGEPVGFQQLSEFVLEADHAVKGFLLRDVFHDLFHVRRAHRKPAIPALPMEV